MVVSLVKVHPIALSKSAAFRLQIPFFIHSVMCVQRSTNNYITAHAFRTSFFISKFLQSFCKFSTEKTCSNLTPFYRQGNIVLKSWVGFITQRVLVIAFRQIWSRFRWERKNVHKISPSFRRYLQIRLIYTLTTKPVKFIPPSFTHA